MSSKHIDSYRFTNVWSHQGIKQIIINFHTLEVVGRGSETQLQVGENVIFFIEHCEMRMPSISI